MSRTAKLLILAGSLALLGLTAVLAAVTSRLDAARPPDSPSPKATAVSPAPALSSAPAPQKPEKPEVTRLRTWVTGAETSVQLAGSALNRVGILASSGDIQATVIACRQERDKVIAARGSVPAAPVPSIDRSYQDLMSQVAAALDSCQLGNFKIAQSEAGLIGTRIETFLASIAAALK